MRVKHIVLCTLAATIFTGCSTIEDTDVTTVPPSQSEASTLASDVFLESKLHVKADITDSSVSPSRILKAEVYVDKEGDGEGLLKFGDNLYDLSIANNIVYVHVSEDIIVELSDLSSRFNFTASDIAGAIDLESFGFTLSDGAPISYAARVANTSVEVTYEKSDHSFETPSVSASESKTLSELCEYIIDYNTEITATTEPVGDGEQTEKKDFYVNSEYGVTIDGFTYSVGDTLNPGTYFNSQSPEGVLISTEYKEDTKVVYNHISYLTSTGRVVFVTVSDYVTSIEVSGDWSFLGITPGIKSSELSDLLGYKLSTREQETFVPIDPDLEVISKSGDNYICEVGDLTVEFRCEKSVLTEIYITKNNS